MPWTEPSQLLSASTDRAWGTRIWKIGSPDRLPIGEEREARAVLRVVDAPRRRPSSSAAASPSGGPGCRRRTWWPRTATTPTMRASLAEAAKTGWGPGTGLLVDRRRCQALMPSISMAAVTRAAVNTWRNELIRVELVMTAQKLVMIARLPIDLVTDGVLHPGVGGEDEVRRQHRADAHQPDRGEVDAGRHPALAEDPDPEEGRLEEEGEQRLHGQRGAEDAARRSASTPTSSSRTGTPGRCPSPRRWRS